MTHHVVSFDWIPDTDGGKILQAARIEYVVKGDQKQELFSIPGFLVAELERDEQGKVRVVKKDVYIDLGPVVQRMEEVYGTA